MSKFDLTAFHNELNCAEQMKQKRMTQIAELHARSVQGTILDYQNLIWQHSQALEGKQVKVIALPGGIKTEMNLFVKSVEICKGEKGELFAILDENGSRFAVLKVLDVEDVE